MSQEKSNAEDNFGIVYKATNTLTDEVYIGITTNSIKQRRWDHTERADRGEQGKLFKALRTYGEDVFNWEQIDTAQNPNELASKEKKYIVRYNTQEKGYNTDSGGEIQKFVYQYDLETKELTNEFESLKKAAKAVNSTKKAISKACLSVNKTHENFFWSYDRTDEFKPPKDARKKPVRQYTMDGTFINQFESVAEAARQTGAYKGCIAKVCRGERKQTGGFKWAYI